MLTILLFVLVSTACFYLGSRAMITRFLWSRYPSWLASFMDCAACTGFWYGLIFANIYGYHRPLPFDLPYKWSFLVGLCSLVWTPIGAAVMQRSLDLVGSAVPGLHEAPWTEPVKIELDPTGPHHINTEASGFTCTCGATFPTTREMDLDQIAEKSAEANQHAAFANTLYGGG